MWYFALHAQTLKDWHLALVVATFIAVDVIILVIYLVHDGVQGTLLARRLKSLENPRAEFGVSSDDF